jgi:hypothetical protein
VRQILARNRGCNLLSHVAKVESISGGVNLERVRNFSTPLKTAAIAPVFARGLGSAGGFVFRVYTFLRTR